MSRRPIILSFSAASLFAIFFIVAGAKEASLRKSLGCIGRSEDDLCCKYHSYKPMIPLEWVNRSCAIVCSEEPVNCLKVITKRIESLGRGGSYFLTKQSAHGKSVTDTVPSVRFINILDSVESLSYSGILELTLRVLLIWQSDASSWNDDCGKLGRRRAACDRFISKTKDHDTLITSPSQTKFYDFLLDSDTETKRLSERLATFPLSISRSGSVEWAGVVHVSLKCDMDVTQFPWDQQICAIKWRKSRLDRHAKASYVCRKNSRFMENVDWRVSCFTHVRDTCFIILQRRPTKTLATLVIPLAMMNGLIFLVYFMPPSSGERVGYSVTLVLSFAVVVMAIGDMFPSSRRLTPMGKVLKGF